MVTEKKFVLVGGGIGSFCFYNCLRIHGIPTEDIAVISLHKKPYHQFKVYCDNLGLTKNERLRSDSGSRPDNFWGFPGYGVSEAVSLFKKREIKKCLKTLIQLLAEPLIFGYYTPTTGQIYESLDREAERIRFYKSVYLGEVVDINILEDGKYEVVVKQKSKRLKIVSTHIHFSLGHGKAKKYKDAVSAYENNEKLFDKIKKTGGSALVVGRGTAAAKIVERILTLKSKRPVGVLSLHSNELPDYADSRAIKQKQFLNWRLQQFNWPRSAFAGELAEKIKENGAYRNLSFWGAPSAVPDKKWISLVNKSALSGKYKVFIGKIPIKPNYIIDARGFDERISENKFYLKLAKKFSLPTNQLGNILLGRNFEIEKMCTYKGRVFLTGIAASGNHYGPVDSFFGQQFAALCAIDLIPEIKKLNTVDSIIGWKNWMLNKKI